MTHWPNGGGGGGGAKWPPTTATDDQRRRPTTIGHSLAPPRSLSRAFGANFITLSRPNGAHGQRRPLCGRFRRRKHWPPLSISFYCRSMELPALRMWPSVGKRESRAARLRAARAALGADSKAISVIIAITRPLIIRLVQSSSVQSSAAVRSLARSFVRSNKPATTRLGALPAAQALANTLTLASRGARLATCGRLETPNQPPEAITQASAPVRAQRRRRGRLGQKSSPNQRHCCCCSSGGSGGNINGCARVAATSASGRNSHCRRRHSRRITREPINGIPGAELQLAAGRRPHAPKLGGARVRVYWALSLSLSLCRRALRAPRTSGAKRANERAQISS